MSDKSDESVISDKALEKFFDGKDYNTSSDSELIKTDDNDQIIGVGDIIEFYHEGYTYGHKFSHPWTRVQQITTPDNGYIRTDFPYYFKHDTEVRIVKKLIKPNRLVLFTYIRNKSFCAVSCPSAPKGHQRLYIFQTIVSCLQM